MIVNNNDSDARLVYSTARGKICPGCGQSVDICACQKIKKAVVSNSAGAVRITYEIKGCKGKGMTLITGLSLSENGLLDLAKKLKQKFGTGGSVKNYVLQLQGDFRKPAALELGKLGFIK